MSENPYLPATVEVLDVISESHDVLTLRLDVKKTSHMPGQFMMLSVFGFGEIPVSVSSSPTITDYIDLSVKKTGSVTSVVHETQPGDTVGLRGPYGRGFPVDEVGDNDLLFMGGGIGLAPLRSFIDYIRDKRDDFNDVSVLYGARTADDMVFRGEFNDWRSMFNLHLIADMECEGWYGRVGYVSELLSEVTLDTENTIAIVCGPSIMMKCVVGELKKLWYPDDKIILSFERRMKCGIGKCGHCNIGDKIVCIDGPVFSFDEVRDSPELWG
ncbi:MAG: hydrogenase [Candidatus Altiarchaeales archaeon ex4484_96]|nr:MAG: hydrogenase [Candidatus Altiarchaeales archaeon ex4484_96]